MKKSTLGKNQKGQLGVFVGMSLLVIISLLAFVINVGLFVKAKINLQNAVDAAAYAGAATQARRLTNIGYLNYEIRNTMKEWLFKYYVLGNMGNEITRNNSGGPLDFRPKKFQATAAANPDAFAKFNIPRNCINFGSKHNICNVYGVPGVPRFPSIGTPGIDELSNTFANQAVSIKSKNCADRSVLNFSTTLMWTFGKGGTNSGIADAPQLLSHRVGAWPQAFELALRMRNLEYIVNRPPIEQGICISEGGDCISITELTNAGGQTPLNERPIAAFMTGFRNLGGGSSAVNNGADHLSIKNTFKLYELAPNGFPFSAGDGLSGYLIPDKTYPGTGFQYSKKHYLDLKILPINYITFFTTFVAANDKFSADINSEGACASSITGIPVPYYITGFAKNPKVLTYYAVKGEAKYMGLFYPFNLDEGITIKAYAAAKPMGGKIGPMLFKVDGNAIFPRDDDASRSRAFVTAMDIASSGSDWKAGLPIPFDKDNEFYLSSTTDPIGGIPTDSSVTPRFSLPNMIHDYIPGSTSTSGGTFIETLESMADESPPLALAGLYEAGQFNSLKSNTPPAGLNGARLEAKVIEARRATKFDALNYLVPTHNAETKNNESPSIVKGEELTMSGVRYKRYNLYAPLCDDQSIYLYECGSGDVLRNLVKEFIDGASGGMNKYLEELWDIADGLRNAPGATGGGSNYVAAANTLANASKRTVGTPDYETDDTDCVASAPLADKFWIFFSTGQDNTLCGVTPLHESTKQYIDSLVANEQTRNFIQPEYFVGGSSDLPEHLESGFTPTPRKGADPSGQLLHPFNGAIEASGKRNSYSTKLISIKKVLSQSDSVSYNDLFPYAESYGGGTLRNGAPPEIVGGDSTIYNILNPSDLNEFGDFKDTF